MRKIAIKLCGIEVESGRCCIPQIPWKNISGMRDKLVHEYWSTDVNILWRMAQQRVPELKVQVIRIRQELQKDK